MTRNRILKPQGGWQYIHMPVKKHPMKSAIREIYVDSEKPWKKKIIKQLDYIEKRLFFTGFLSGGRAAEHRQQPFVRDQ